MAIEFIVWDAPEFGFPRPDCASLQWSDSQLVATTLGRSRNGDKSSPPEVTVMSMDLALAGSNRLGMTMGALLDFTDELAEMTGMSSREAAVTVNELAETRGAVVSLVIDGAHVAAERHEISQTGAWVVTATDLRYAVCVAGRSGVSLPELRPADLAPWRESLQEQLTEVEGAPPS